MGLGDVKGDKCFEVLADIIAPVMRIAQDEESMKFFKKEDRPEGITDQQYGLYIMENYFPLLLKAHKDDFAEILAALNGKTKKEYLKNLTFTSMFNDIYSLITDKTFMSFLA